MVEDSGILQSGDFVNGEHMGLGAAAQRGRAWSLLLNAAIAAEVSSGDSHSF